MLCAKASDILTGIPSDILYDTLTLFGISSGILTCISSDCVFVLACFRAFYLECYVFRSVCARTVLALGLLVRACLDQAGAPYPVHALACPDLTGALCFSGLCVPTHGWSSLSCAGPQRPRPSGTPYMVCGSVHASASAGNWHLS